MVIISKKRVMYVFLIILLILFYPFTQGRWKLSKGVTVENIRKIKLSMKEKEVIKILGDPFYVSKEYKMGAYPFVYKRPFYHGELEKEKIKRKYIMIFSKDVKYSRWYPMLYVLFKDGRVEMVYAKRYNFFDKIGVYSKSKNDSWELELFEKSFPHSKK